MNSATEERRKKFNNKSSDECYNLLWQWCKQNVITLNEFKILLKEIDEMEQQAIRDDIFD